MANNGNPLIGENPRDTIDRMHEFAEWLCQSADGDDSTHPGMLSALRLILGAASSLKQGGIE